MYNKENKISGCYLYLNLYVLYLKGTNKSGYFVQCITEQVMEVVLF